MLNPDPDIRARLQSPGTRATAGGAAAEGGLEIANIARGPAVAYGEWPSRTREAGRISYRCRRAATDGTATARITGATARASGGASTPYTWRCAARRSRRRATAAARRTGSAARGSCVAAAIASTAGTAARAATSATAVAAAAISAAIAAVTTAAAPTTAFGSRQLSAVEVQRIERNWVRSEEKSKCARGSEQFQAAHAHVFLPACSSRLA
jgi:hypothetical protein